MTAAHDDRSLFASDSVLAARSRDLPTASWEFSHLLEALRSNDPRAHHEVSARFGGRIRAYAVARGAEDPDGIVNETLLVVFLRSLTFTGSESHFTSAVFSIARNKIVDEVRRIQRRPPVTSIHRSSILAHSHDTADQYVSESITRSILGRLEADQRDVVIMRTLLGMTFREIGEAMGRQEVTVRVIHHRALARLRLVLEEAT